jgi:hypothetical protein
MLVDVREVGESLLDGRENDEFARIELVARMDRLRALIAQYRVNEEQHIGKLLDQAHKLGALDERLGGNSDA